VCSQNTGEPGTTDGKLRPAHSKSSPPPLFLRSPPDDFLLLARQAMLLSRLLDIPLPLSLNGPTVQFGTQYSRTFSSPVCFFLTLPKIPFLVNPSAECGLKQVIDKVREKNRSVGDIYDQHGQYQVYYYRSPLYWIRGMDFLPNFESATATRSVHHFKDFNLTDASLIQAAGCLINSSLFYVWFIVYGNGRNVALRDIQ